MTKICSKCKEEKDISEFHRDNYSKDGYRSQCKICVKKYKEQNKEKIREQQKDYCIQSEKKIKEYQKKYYEQNKEKIKLQTQEYRKQNRGKIKERRKKYFKEYRRQNEEYLEEYQKEYREQNKEKRKDYDKKYRERNKDKINNRIKKKYHDDVCYRIRIIISTQVCQNLKFKNSSKNNSSILQYLPYTIQQFKENLENQFEPWMNWENYGNHKNDGIRRWNIDHIIPQSKLLYDSMEHPNFQKCWALENLRPMEAIENIKKSNKV